MAGRVGLSWRREQYDRSNRAAGQLQQDLQNGRVGGWQVGGRTAAARLAAWES